MSNYGQAFKNYKSLSHKKSHLARPSKSHNLDISNVMVRFTKTVSHNIYKSHYGLAYKIYKSLSHNLDISHIMAT